MTHEEVAILWKDANGWDVRGYTNTLEDLGRFAKLVAAKEREALTNVATEDTSKERVDEMQKQRHEQGVVPAPQRTWVGLTNNDLQPIAEEYRILFGSWVHDFARAIEAKLKEKNSA